MYRNLNKSKYLAALSTENTFDSFRYNRTKLNTSQRTTSQGKKTVSEENSKEESLPLLPMKEKQQSTKFQFKLKFTKNNNGDLIKKKIIKGRLMKLINTSSLEHHIEEEEPRVAKVKPSKTIKMNFFPNLIGSDMKAVARNHDIVTTPEELIFQNFSQEEIEIIKSNANYFKINSDEHFRNINIFKNRHLLEILEEEDNKIKKKKSLSKSILSPIKIKKIMKEIKKESTMMTAEEMEEKLEQERQKNKPERSLSKVKNFKKRLTKFLPNLNEFNKTRGTIDTKIKFQKYGERKREFLQFMNNNFKKKLEKNNQIRLNAEKKKKIEFEDNVIINTFTNLIRENYTLQKA